MRIGEARVARLQEEVKTRFIQNDPCQHAEALMRRLTGSRDEMRWHATQENFIELDSLKVKEKDWGQFAIWMLSTPPPPPEEEEKFVPFVPNPLVVPKRGVKPGIRFGDYIQKGTSNQGLGNTSKIILF